MIPFLVDRHAAIVALCQKHGVARLDVFGSAGDGRFDPEHSDLDFLVTLSSEDAIQYKRNYVALREGLVELFGREVDLVTEASIRNPYFRRGVDASRVQLYAA